MLQVWLRYRVSDCLCLEVADQHFDLFIRALGIYYSCSISFLELGPLFICLLNDFDNFILREVDMLAFIEAFCAISWLTLIVYTGLLLALVEDLLSVA